MEQSRSTINQSSLLTSATEDEIIVSQFLLHLKTAVSLTESLANFNWGRRRRRSRPDEDPLLPASSSLPSAVQGTGIEIKEMRLRIGEKSGAAAASPNSPLSFSPSESNGKSKCKKTSKERARDEYLNVIEGLSGSRDVLRVEVENVKKLYIKLMAYNSELKTIKQKMIVEMSGRVNFGADMGPHQQPYISNPTAQQEFRCPIGPMHAEVRAFSDGPDHVGPLGIDLNFPAAEGFGQDSSRPLDARQTIADRRATFAEARRKRRGVLKEKSLRRLCSKKSPTDLQL